MNSPFVKNIPLLDVNRGNAPLREEFIEALTRVVDSGRFLFGPDVQQLERSVAERCGVEHAIACASGSDALLLALLALDIGDYDEVIVPSFTFFATASAVTRVGATPVFVDIEPATFNLDPACVKAAITPRTKAIIPVHLFGQCADMSSIMSLGLEHNIPVIEDAAQAIDAKHGGAAAGSMGAIGCFSFYPTKNLGGMGDGGLLTTNDPKLAERLRLFAAHGMNPRYHHKVIGINSRLDTLQAAVLNVKLKHLQEWSAARTTNALRYHEGLAANHDLGLPIALQGNEHVWNQYTVRVPNGQRNAVKQRLTEAGVGCEIYYPIPLHQQECYRSLGYRTGSLPETERAAAEVLSLPIFPELTAEEQYVVIERLEEALAPRRAAAA
ncbi:DegT/DnrJ/EryC1/StrS family aminotransferase [Anatilimnocola floriformis]|uniref:DegT/DnrJ/EryC1/StrS family aminotransferase n=1 Tax=Anatilimnocola floriformis TaxID=2948575 RepID=UPI0020C43360|nr:DegT/DnrJ/EryC1/StrS family aminotransferase [Anatilimnocola floriformis]